MKVDIRKLLEAGHASRTAAKAEKEAAVAGHPRIGSVGIVAEDGQVYGVCHRKALARSVGIEEEVGLHTRVMWRMGELYEQAFCELLELGNPEIGFLQDHEDMFVNAQLQGVDKEVLGHPDIILARKVVIRHETIPDASVSAVGQPYLGIEHKGVFSYGTAALVYFDDKPKNDNLIQAAAYSHFLKLPFELWYTSSSYYSIPVYDKKKYGGGSIAPFYKGFKLEWREGVLYYQPEGGAWVKTPITGQAIEDYYRLVAEMPERKELGPRVNSTYLDGTANRWGDRNDCKFCPFAAACDRYESDKDFDLWLDGIKVVSQSKEVV